MTADGDAPARGGDEGHADLSSEYVQEKKLSSLSASTGTARMESEGKGWSQMEESAMMWLPLGWEREKSVACCGIADTNRHCVSLLSKK